MGEPREKELARQRSSLKDWYRDVMVANDLHDEAARIAFLEADPQYAGEHRDKLAKIRVLEQPTEVLERKIFTLEDVVKSAYFLTQDACDAALRDDRVFHACQKALAEKTYDKVTQIGDFFIGDWDDKNRTFLGKYVLYH